jgi:hypothetical protein
MARAYVPSWSSQMVRCFRIGRAVAMEPNTVHEAWNSWTSRFGLKISSKDRALGNGIFVTRRRRVTWTSKDENVVN